MRVQFAKDSSSEHRSSHERQIAWVDRVVANQLQIRFPFFSGHSTAIDGQASMVANDNCVDNGLKRAGCNSDLGSQ